MKDTGILALTEAFVKTSMSTVKETYKENQNYVRYYGLLASI